MFLEFLIYIMASVIWFFKHNLCQPAKLLQKHFKIYLSCTRLACMSLITLQFDSVIRVNYDHQTDDLEQNAVIFLYSTGLISQCMTCMQYSVNIYIYFFRWEWIHCCMQHINRYNQHNLGNIIITTPGNAQYTCVASKFPLYLYICKYYDLSAPGVAVNINRSDPKVVNWYLYVNTLGVMLFFIFTSWNYQTQAFIMGYDKVHVSEFRCHWRCNESQGVCTGFAKFRALFLSDIYQS